MASHEYYTGLSSSAACALAISGQLSEQEGGEWIEHCGSCAECRQLTRDFMQVSFRLLPHGDAAVNGTDRVLEGTPQESVEHARFKIPRAETSAENLRQVVHPRRPRLWSFAVCTAVAASLVLAFALGSRFGTRRNAPLLSSSQRQAGNGSADIDSAAQTRALLAESERLKDELQRAGKRDELLAGQLRERTDALASAQRKEADLNSRITALENANTELSNKDSERNSELAQLRQDLARLHSENDANHHVATQAKVELLDRGAEVKRLIARLADAEQLIATLKEAQDLVEGRKVHLWTVYHTDENGKRQRAFGRILYTEGERLVFYAYDLAQQENIDTRISFYVWGEKSGTRRPVKNLGMLHLDDAKKGRWKLTVGDQNVLAQINSVFVTAEPDRNLATEPSGKRMLSASLDSKTDHP